MSMEKGAMLETDTEKIASVDGRRAIRVRTALPGPRSRALVDERRRYVSVGVAEAKHGIFFERAEGPLGAR